MNSIYCNKYIKQYLVNLIEKVQNVNKIKQQEIRLYTVSGEKIVDFEYLKKHILNKQFNNYLLHQDYINNKLNKCKELYNILRNNYTQINSDITNKYFILLDNINYINNSNINKDTIYIFNNNIYETIKLIQKFIQEYSNKNKTITLIIILYYLNVILHIYNIIYARLQIKFSLITDNKNIFHINIDYLINNFFNKILIDCILVYTNIDSINTEITQLLNIYIAKKINAFNTDETELVELVNLLKKYKIIYIYDIFNLEYYLTQKQNELINDNDKFYIIKKSIIRYLYNNKKILHKNINYYKFLS